MNFEKEIKQKVVWLLEDEAELAESYLDFLSPHLTVHHFDDPLKAEAAFFEDNKPDLVVTDLKMPQRSGLRFIRDLQTKGHHCPAILISGFAEKAHALEAIELGVSGFIEKPFDPRQLLSLIRNTMALAVANHFKDQLIAAFEGQVSLLRKYNDIIYDRMASSENIVAERGLKISTLYRSVEEQISFFHKQNELQGALNQYENEAAIARTLIQSLEQGLGRHSLAAKVEPKDLF